MKYIKKLNIDFDQWDKLPNQGWHNMKFVEGKTIDYYKKMYPEGTKVRIRKDSKYYYHDYIDVSNPKDIIGYLKYENNNNNDIIKIKDYIFYVEWNNGFSNSYSVFDLEYFILD
jgi:hypothetical protein